MRSAWVGLALVVACGGSDTRPIVPKQPLPEPVAPTPVVAAPPPPVAQQQQFAPASPAPTFADPDRRAKLVAAFPALDKALEQERVAEGAGGVVVGVVIDGELAYAKGFGVVDPDSKAVPDADTVYRIGSISKSFTGLALMSLRDDGVVQLDDPLAKWIPEAGKIVYPTRDERPITLRQLAQHTSGLPRMGPFDPEHGPDEATVVGSLAKITLERAPGLESVYSNLGFSLLGIAVSHAAKQPLHDVIAHRIFGPLGMSSSGWDAATVPTGHLAPALGPDGKPKPATLLGAADGAGGIYSSVRDMGRYAAFLLAAYPPRDGDDRGPIKRSTIRDAQYSGFAMAPQVAAVDNAKHGEPTVHVDAMSYGFGWLRDQSCAADDTIEHNGRIDSYNADITLRPSNGVAVIVMTNFDVDVHGVGDRALAILEATGAMKHRVPALPDPGTYTPLVTAFLAIYNSFDKDKLAAIMARPLGPNEPDELASYKALHGTCSAFKLSSIGDNGELRFAMTCEHGPFELALGIQGGKLGGFFGRSPGIAPPADVKKLIAAAIALHFDPVWSAANYKLVFPKHLIPEGAARSTATSLRAQFGTCKQGAVTREGLGWSIELACSKTPAVLSLQLDKDGVIDSIFFSSPQGAEPPRCPTR